MFLLQEQGVFANPSHTVGVTVASSSVSKEENDRPSVGRRDVALELFLLCVYFNPKAEEEVGRMGSPSRHLLGLGFVLTLSLSCQSCRCCRPLPPTLSVSQQNTGLFVLVAGKTEKASLFKNTILLKSCPMKNKVDKMPLHTMAEDEIPFGAPSQVGLPLLVAEPTASNVGRLIKSAIPPLMKGHWVCVPGSHGVLPIIIFVVLF